MQGEIRCAGPAQDWSPTEAWRDAPCFSWRLQERFCWLLGSCLFVHPSSSTGCWSLGPPALTQHREYPSRSLHLWERGGISSHAAGRNLGWGHSAQGLQELMGPRLVPRGGAPWRSWWLGSHGVRAASPRPRAAGLLPAPSRQTLLPHRLSPMSASKSSPRAERSRGRGQRLYQQQRNVGTMFVSLTLPPKKEKAGWILALRDCEFIIGSAQSPTSAQGLALEPSPEPKVPARSQISVDMSVAPAPRAPWPQRLGQHTPSFLTLHFERMSIPGGFYGLNGATPGLHERVKGVGANRASFRDTLPPTTCFPKSQRPRLSKSCPDSQICL